MLYMLTSTASLSHQISISIAVVFSRTVRKSQEWTWHWLKVERQDVKLLWCLSRSFCLRISVNVFKLWELSSAAILLSKTRQGPPWQWIMAAEAMKRSLSLFCEFHRFGLSDPWLQWQEYRTCERLVGGFQKIFQSWGFVLRWNLN